MRGRVIEHPAAGRNRQRMAAECGSKPQQRCVQRAVGFERDRAAVDAGEIGVRAAEQVERMEAADGRALPSCRIEQLDRRRAAAVDERLGRRARRVEPQRRGGRREMVVGHGQEDQVGGVDHLLRRVDRPAAVDARGECRGRFCRAARDRDDRKAGRREAPGDAAREAAGADEAEAGSVGEGHDGPRSENGAAASIAGMTGWAQMGGAGRDDLEGDGRYGQSVNSRRGFAPR
ncbi:SctT [Burkholderia ambifaria MEX-5]|uniref:SctT n=1 Tax=Burkholderia ambifaria MEX-5 TaxID=396597 RepID=B1TD18_9BURK|nr:SctT [Burkholderia ambifaria MEX-5]